MNKHKIQILLDSIYTDLLMLKDDEWQPDEDSCKASIDIIKELGKELKIKPKDLRDGNETEL